MKHDFWAYRDDELEYAYVSAGVPEAERAPTWICAEDDRWRWVDWCDAMETALGRRVRMTGDRVAVRLDAPQSVSEGGIIHGTSNGHTAMTGVVTNATVLAVGPGKRHESRQYGDVLIPTGLHPGGRVCLMEFAGFDSAPGGERGRVRFVHVADIIGHVAA